MNRIKGEDRKLLIRRLESILQVGLLTILYYFMWLLSYQDVTFPYLGRGKYVLMGIYAVLVMILFHYSDGFNYGHSKLSDITVSQCISIFLVNFVTYWQLSLISNVMIAVPPMLLLTVIDAVICVSCCFIYNNIYHKYHTPRDMVMIYGTESALELEEKMAMRGDKYQITEVISVEDGFEVICEKIKKHQAV